MEDLAQLLTDLQQDQITRKELELVRPVSLNHFELRSYNRTLKQNPLYNKEVLQIITIFIQDIENCICPWFYPLKNKIVKRKVESEFSEPFYQEEVYNQSKIVLRYIGHPDHRARDRHNRIGELKRKSGNTKQPVL